MIIDEKLKKDKLIKKNEIFESDSEQSLSRLNEIDGSSSRNIREIWNGRIRTLEHRKQKGILNKLEIKDADQKEDPT